MAIENEIVRFIAEMGNEMAKMKAEGATEGIVRF